MTKLSRWRNIAAGLLGSFVSRNNDVGGYWALGLLYAESDELRMRLDLLARTAMPDGVAATTVARNYGELLRRAMEREGIEQGELVGAAVELRFATLAMPPPFHYQAEGDPFACTITLRTSSGQVVTREAYERCWRQQPALFSPSGRA